MSTVSPTNVPEKIGGVTDPTSVLSTLNEDGSRRWLKPRPSFGDFWKRRRVAAFLLVVLFVALPHIHINGKPAVLLDLAARRFTLFGQTFLPTDTLLLALMMVGVFLTIFFVTAIFGRVWCGWACPQTVYMEFLYRPIERFFDGTPGRAKKTTGLQGWLHTSGAGTPLKYIAFFLASCFLAHTFLAYFVGVDKLVEWIQRSPLEHPASFLIMAGVTLAMMFDFAFFREQTCLVACPYGRMQSVLLDRNSLIVSYDRVRGEPRGQKAKHETGERASLASIGMTQPVALTPALSAGSSGGVASIALPVLGVSHASSPTLDPKRTADCVDCKLCVQTCPTGIDIRNGLQMECIHCTQCIDACDAVMEKLGRPKGLIRYGSQATMLPQPGEKPHLVRPRLIVYATLLLIVWTAFFTVLATRPPAYVSIRRGTGAPFYSLPTGEIANPVRVSIINRTNDLATYVVSVDPAAGRLIADKLEVTLLPAQAAVLPVTLAAMPAAFEHGQHAVQVRVVADGNQASHGYEKTFTYRMLGPTHKRASQWQNKSHDEGEDREAEHKPESKKEDK